MNLKIEIVGLPASGKTYFYKHLKKKIKKNKIKFIETSDLKDHSIKQYLQTKTKINLLKKLTYKLYIKTIQIKSNLLFKKEYEDFNKFIGINLKKDKNYKKISILYKKYVNSTNYTLERKSRILKNFEIDFIGANFFDSKSRFNIFDEGFFQKIFFNFNNKKNLKFNLKEQNKYLNLVPHPNLIILIDVNIKTCLERSKNRKDGFLYDIEILKKSKNNYFNKSIINFAKSKKIPIIKLKGTNSINKNLNFFFKEINKYK